MSASPDTLNTSYSPVSTEAHQAVLSTEALEFLSLLHKQFESERRKLLENRIAVQAKMDSGAKFEFPERTAHIRSGDWVIAPQPAHLADRRVELIVQPNTENIAQARKANASIGIIDLEDGLSPTWANVLDAHKLLKNLNHGNDGGDTTAWMIRPRALHADESHLSVDHDMISASLFDFGLHVFHCAKGRADNSTGIYFYISKLEHYREARWWNNVFLFAEAYLNLPIGTIRSTLTVETMPAIFQLDEMLYELRDHSAGISCGKQNYLFSFIKHFGAKSGYILPDRDQISLATPFLEDYATHIIYVAHRRNAPAIGITFSGLPHTENDTLREECFTSLKRTKDIEIELGFDGTRVVHVDQINAVQGFWPDKNEQKSTAQHYRIDPKQMLRLPSFQISELQIRRHIHTGLYYIAAWLSGQGSVEIYGTMEDKTGAEMARAQLWQWIQARVRLSDGTTFDKPLYLNWFDEEFQKVRSLTAKQPSVSKHLSNAAELFLHLTTSKDQTAFITDLAYPMLVNVN